MPDEREMAEILADIVLRDPRVDLGLHRAATGWRIVSVMGKALNPPIWIEESDRLFPTWDSAHRLVAIRLDGPLHLAHIPLPTPVSFPMEASDAR